MGLREEKFPNDFVLRVIGGLRGLEVMAFFPEREGRDATIRVRTSTGKWKAFTLHEVRGSSCQSHAGTPWAPSDAAAFMRRVLAREGREGREGEES